MRLALRAVGLRRPQLGPQRRFHAPTFVLLADKESNSPPNIFNLDPPPEKKGETKMNNTKSDFDAIFDALLKKNPVSDTAKPTPAPRQNSAAELLNSLFGTSSSETEVPEESAAESADLPRGHQLDSMFEVEINPKRKITDLKLWDIYPLQVKKWLLFTKTSKGYYDNNGQWVSILALKDLMNTYSTKDSELSIEKWEELYAKEQELLPEDLRGRFRFAVQYEEIKDLHPKIRRLFSMTFATEREKLDLRKSLALQKWKSHEFDTASPAIQVDILTQRIRSLDKHLKANKKDKANLRIMATLVRRRKGQMLHLKKRDPATYYAVLTEIGLKDLYDLYPEKRISKLPTKYRK